MSRRWMRQWTTPISPVRRYCLSVHCHFCCYTRVLLQAVYTDGELRVRYVHMPCFVVSLSLHGVLDTIRVHNAIDLVKHLVPPRIGHVAAMRERLTMISSRVLGGFACALSLAMSAACAWRKSTLTVNVENAPCTCLDLTYVHTAR